MTTRDFIYVEHDNIHKQRQKEILEKYPEVKELLKPYAGTAFHIPLCIAAQVLAAYLLRDSAWWLIVIVAYLIGAFLSHSLYVLLHEASHNAIFKKRVWNKIFAIMCDFGLFFPTAASFSKYHMIHHRHLNEKEMDPDVVHPLEGKLVGNNPLLKTLWLLFFSISQALRPMKVPNTQLWDHWTVINIATQIMFNGAIYYFFGMKAIGYIAISTFFALGLHPLGGRWLQEHYVTEEGQETYSYYGPINKIAYNIGYHNEHHDFMAMPWINLPKLRKIAPEYYNNLKSYRSLTSVVTHYLFSSDMHPFKRIIHPTKVGKLAKKTRNNQKLEHAPI